MHLSGVLYPKILRNSNDALQDQKIIYEAYMDVAADDIRGETCSSIFSATFQEKLPAPCPRSIMTPRLRAFTISGRLLPLRSSGLLGSPRKACVRISPFLNRASPSYLPGRLLYTAASVPFQDTSSSKGKIGRGTFFHSSDRRFEGASPGASPRRKRLATPL